MCEARGCRESLRSFICQLLGCEPWSLLPLSGPTSGKVASWSGTIEISESWESVLWSPLGRGFPGYQEVQQSFPREEGE
jgi:hypothetical protein